MLLKCCTQYSNKFRNLTTGLEKASFHSNSKERQYQRMFKPPYSCAHITTSKVMLKTLQGRLQQYVNQELPEVQAGFSKGRGTRDQIANVRWLIEKVRQFQKNIYFCFIDHAIAFDCGDHTKLDNSERDGNIRPPYLLLEKPLYKTRSNS